MVRDWRFSLAVFGVSKKRAVLDTVFGHFMVALMGFILACVLGLTSLVGLVPIFAGQREPSGSEPTKEH